MLTYKSGADVTDFADTLRTGAQRKGGLAQVPSALALLQVFRKSPTGHTVGHHWMAPRGNAFIQENPHGTHRDGTEQG